MMENPEAIPQTTLPHLDFLESNQSNATNDSTASSGGDSNSLCLETTIFEIEELMGDEEEFRSFLDSVSKEDSSDVKEPLNNKQTLDLNCNEVKDPLSIPVIDITISDGSDTEECFVKDTDQCTTAIPLSTLSDNVFIPKSVLSVDQNFNQPINSDTLSPVSSDCSLDSISFGTFSDSEPNDPPKSELLNLGVKNVSASFLDFQPPEKSETPAPSATLPLDMLSSEVSGELSPRTGHNLEEIVEQNISMRQSIETITMDFLSSGCELTDVDSPSPYSERILLQEADHAFERSDEIVSSEAALPTASSDISCALKPNLFQETETSVCEKIESLPFLSAAIELEGCETNESLLVPSPAAESEGCEKIESLLVLSAEPEGCESSGFASIPSPPPACELFGELEEESCTVTLPPVPSPQSVARDIGAEVETWVQDAGVKLEASAAQRIEPLKVETPDIVSKEVPSSVPEELQDLELKYSNLPGVGLNDVNTVQTGSSPKSEKPSWAVPWISTDDAENADNNDPEWKLLQKLETDEERYRVVREKWRQLSIPDPRQDLTRHNFRRARSQAARVPLSDAVIGERQSRKRARSCDGSDNEEHPSKRRRIFSCTQMFDNKINFLRNQLDEEFEVLKGQHHRKLSELSVHQQHRQQQLINSTAPPHIIQHQFSDLAYRQEREVDDLNFEFDGKLHQISKSRMDTIRLLQKASDEVFAFNKFYTDLESTDDDHCMITEDEFQQFEETEQMYDLYDQVYSG